jgi:hypothetical protein
MEDLDPLPDHSEEHNRLLGALVSIRDQLNPSTIKQLADHGHETVIDKFLRLNFEADNTVTLSPPVDESDRPDRALPAPLTEIEMERLVSEGSQVLARAEENL